MSAFPERSLPELRRAFDGLVAEHEPGLQRFCRSFLRDDTLAADASQETLLRLWRKLLLGQEPEHPGAWLRRVASRCATDLLRGRGREEKAVQALLNPTSSTAPDLQVDALAAEELKDRYEAALTELPEQQRIVFLLRHEAGMRLSEVASALDLGLPTIKTHFARACLKLQSQLRAFKEDRQT